MYKYFLYFLGLLNLVQINIINPMAHKNSLANDAKCIIEKNVYGNLALVNNSTDHPYLSLEFYDKPKWANGTIVILLDEKSTTNKNLSNNPNASFIVNTCSFDKNITSCRSVILMGTFTKTFNTGLNAEKNHWLLKIQNIYYSDSSDSAIAHQEIPIDKYLNYAC